MESGELFLSQEKCKWIVQKYTDLFFSMSYRRLRLKYRLHPISLWQQRNQETNFKRYPAKIQMEISRLRLQKCRPKSGGKKNLVFFCLFVFTSILQ